MMINMLFKLYNHVFDFVDLIVPFCVHFCHLIEEPYGKSERVADLSRRLPFTVVHHGSVCDTILPCFDLHFLSVHTPAVHPGFLS